MEWEPVVEALSAVGSENHTVNDNNKKRSDRKVEMKRRAAVHQPSVVRIDSGSGIEDLTPLASHCIGTMWHIL